MRGDEGGRNREHNVIREGERVRRFLVFLSQNWEIFIGVDQLVQCIRVCFLNQAKNWSERISRGREDPCCVVQKGTTRAMSVHVLERESWW